MAAKLKDGLPRRAFAYAPTADPSTWKLPYLTADGTPDPDHLPGAAAALSSGGFRGQKADIPADAVAAVKSRLRSAYRKWKGSSAEYPAGIAETATLERDGFSIREATILLDKSPTRAQVIFAPGGDAIVVPEWEGAFTQAAKPYVPNPPYHENPLYDVEAAAGLLSRLASLKRDETDDPAQMAMLDQAIAGVTDFLKSEADEIGTEAEAQPAADCYSCNHPPMCDCTDCPCTMHGSAMAEAGAHLERSLTAFREVGKRHSAKDAEVLKQLIKMVKNLGIEVDEEAIALAVPEVNPPAVVTEAYVLEDGVEKAVIAFREASWDQQVVTLAEAAPKFDRENRTVWITPIKPGWGNKRDNNFYPTETLKEATTNGRFNHLKMFMDHPRKSDEKDLPERSVKDWFATTREAVWDASKAVPRVPVKVHDQAVYDRFEEAPEQIAFSVLGGGFARVGEVAGRKGKVVESIEKVRSVDWVTEAGAGGAIAFSESAHTADEELDMTDIKDMTVEQLDALKESNPSLYDHVIGLAKAMSAKATEPVAPAPAAAADKTEPVVEDEAKSKAKATEPVKEAVAEEPEWARKLAERLERQEVKEAAAEKAAATEKGKADAAVIVKAAVAESTLPKAAKELVETSFAEAAVGDGMTYADEDALKAAVGSQVEAAAKLIKAVGGKGVTGLDASTEKGEGKSIREAATDRIESQVGGVQTPPKSRYAWSAEEMGGMPMATGSTVPVEPVPGQASLSESGQKAADKLGAAIGL